MVKYLNTNYQYGGDRMCTEAKSMSMDWDKLLNEKRLRGSSKVKKSTDARNAFENDYMRIISSSAFRRLQDKAQVFPLERNDFVRTRLTHSIEVAAIAESIGISIEEFLIKENKISKKDKGKISRILSCVGLLHDIGNTPFGHYGECSIQDYFRNIGKETVETAKPDKKNLVREYEGLSEQQRKDFECFDGNAQAFRNISYLQSMQYSGGLNLTAATMSALIKYPRSSIEGNNKDLGKISYKKFGYLASENKIFKDIVRLTGITDEEGNILRNPLVYLLEAADDIAYCVSDVEDGIKKGLLTIEYLESKIIKTIYEEYGKENIDSMSEEDLEEDEILKNLKDKSNNTLINIYKYITKNNIDHYKDIIIALSGKIEFGNPNDNFIRCQMLRVAIQSTMITAVLEEFKNSYEYIMNGTYEKDIVESSKAKNMRIMFKGISTSKIFNNKDVVKNELAGGKVVYRLLDLFLKAMTSECDDKGRPTGAREQRLYNLISDNYKGIYEEETDHKFYSRVQLVIDFISGMTDYYALDLYKHIQGIIIS
ncbi:dNTP triphosphohydrolase [Paeniclostridium sordellii]|nr:dNTP triphosphohydrolase [Paeniclostridium sordellii]MSB59645.1 dNTP triphosphohydrolase [Paeniclostridium sordellii]